MCGHGQQSGVTKPVVFSLECAQGPAGQIRNVFQTFPEWWQGHREVAKPVENVASETALGDFLVQLGIAGGDYPHIHLHGMVRAHGFDSAFLKKTQDGRLLHKPQFVGTQ